MVKIRLQRFGGKKNPFYRVVAAHATAPRDGKFIELLGTYNPVSYRFEADLKADRIKYWLHQGAQPTETVTGLLKKTGILS